MDPVQFKPILFKDQLYINGYSLCHTGNCTTEILQERETCFQKTNLVALGGHGVPWADSKIPSDYFILRKTNKTTTHQTSD